MKIEKILITPTMAKELLEKNINNRNVKQPVVARYAKDMIAGKWKQDTAELIKISKTGLILDGQHRLLAIVKANVSIYFHIASELEDNIFDVLDTGSIRNSCDVFNIQNIKNYNCVRPLYIRPFCSRIYL